MLHKGKLVLGAAAVALSLGVAGCDTTITPDQIAQIQANAVRICGFLPTAIDISSAIPGVAAYTVPASAVAQAICALVTKSSKRFGATAAGVDQSYSTNVVVAGHTTHVTITGHFVGKGRHK